MISIELPWPSADLSPNGRVHWAVMAREKKKARTHAWGFTKAMMGPLGIASGSFVGPVSVRLVFHPAMDRARDVDNMQARMKAALDGIADALGVNDTLFRPVSEIGAKRKPACVVVTLAPAEILKQQEAK